MTLENCQRLLKHYNDLADGTIKQPFGHKDWADVVYNAKLRAVVMKRKVDWKSSPEFRAKHNIPEPEKPEVKTKSKGKK